MSLRIVRNDITRMECDAIVNTANEFPEVGPGCDTAVYKAAGYEKLLSDRQKIGRVPEGEVFLTKGYDLPASYIIHAVSPAYHDGSHGEEKLLRSCYQKSLLLAAENRFTSVAFPLISTGNFGYPKEEGLRIAADEINAFLLNHVMEIYLVVFDSASRELAGRITADLEEYIDQNYVRDRGEEEYNVVYSMPAPAPSDGGMGRPVLAEPSHLCNRRKEAPRRRETEAVFEDVAVCEECKPYAESEPDFSALDERMQHLSDTFSEYLLYLIKSRGMENAEAYKKALVDKKLFAKIKKDRNYHPKKITAMQFCVALGLNLDETRDLLSRAGYAMSPCDKTDVIFRWFIENKIYDMIEVDIQLEEHGLPCLID